MMCACTLEIFWTKCWEDNFTVFAIFLSRHYQFFREEIGKGSFKGLDCPYVLLTLQLAL
jgi:hypothetical protein